MSRVILLDAGPLGLVTKRRGVPEAEACRAWVARCLRQEAHILVPAIAYYEVCRELERMRNTTGLARVEGFAARCRAATCPSPMPRSGAAAGCGRRRARLGPPRRSQCVGLRCAPGSPSPHPGRCRGGPRDCHHECGPSRAVCGDRAVDADYAMTRAHGVGTSADDGRLPAGLTPRSRRNGGKWVHLWD